MADDFWTWTVWTPILITLVSGSVSALATKIVYDTPIDGTASCGRSTFQKPYYFTLCMFIGEFLCLIVYFMKQFLARRRQAAADDYQALGGRDISPKLSGVNQLTASSSFVGSPIMENTSESDLIAPAVKTKKPPVWVYAILCIFDLSATSVNGVGLIWVDVSTNQMLRGSMVVFCAIFSVLMLNRRLTRSQWSSILIVCLGLGLVGLSGMLKKKYDPATTGDSANVSSGQLMIGLCLILFGSALNAVQNVFEEKLLKAVGAAEVDPLELVGWEGLFGLSLSAFVLLPIVYYIPGSDCGRAEDTLNTLAQLSNSPLAIMLSLAFIFGLGAMNFTSQQISAQLSAVHRNLVSAVRTVLVWACSTVLYYITANDTVVYGEKWTNWSLLELSGFIVLVVGTILYSRYSILASQAAEELAEKTDPTHTHDFDEPDFAVPIEATLNEHAVILKQQHSRSRKNSHAYDDSM